MVDESIDLPLSIITSAVFALLGALIPIAYFPFLTSDIFAQIGMVLLTGLADAVARGPVYIRAENARAYVIMRTEEYDRLSAPS